MQSKMNCSEQSIMQLELFPDLVCRNSSRKQSKTFTKRKYSGLLPIPDRVRYCNELLDRCRAFGHCSSISVLTALCCLYEEVETYTFEQFSLDIQPYL